MPRPSKIWELLVRWASWNSSFSKPHLNEDILKLSYHILLHMYSMTDDNPRGSLLMRLHQASDRSPRPIITWCCMQRSTKCKIVNYLYQCQYRLLSYPELLHLISIKTVSGTLIRISINHFQLIHCPRAKKSWHS